MLQMCDFFPCLLLLAFPFGFLAISLIQRFNTQLGPKYRRSGRKLDHCTEVSTG